MKLPKKIYPDPIVSSTIEIRFKSLMEKKNILPSFLSNFYTELNSFEQSNIPPELKQADDILKYYPDYTLKNDKYSLSFSDVAFAFENVSEYTLWENYSSFIFEKLKKIFELNLIDKIDRIGLRFASLINQTGDLNRILINTPNISVADFDNLEFKSYSCVVSKDLFNLHLKINSNQELLAKAKERKGLLIDIDASFENKHNEDFSYHKTCEIISDLHSVEKKLFFSLLKEKFIEEELQPTY
ncbi:TIGR04255 family protein [Flavobacterium rhizosphaerae]|uniref:TIGR04255 family protein n=1 Tax=Flavobacterium rhizosphaerae TaxID=3163298 RepID=A0ABW8YXM4_9FLAO